MIARVSRAMTTRLSIMSKTLDCYLRSYRRRWGLTQRELAILIGYRTHAVISRLEQTASRPTLETVYALEVLFGTAPHELFPGLKAAVRDAIIPRVRERYEELQGNSSRTTRVKLDFFEDIFQRHEAGILSSGV